MLKQLHGKPTRPGKRQTEYVKGKCSFNKDHNNEYLRFDDMFSSEADTTSLMNSFTRHFLR